MRRITYAVMATLSALVALFSYHTSTNSGISLPRPASAAETGQATTDPTGGTASGTSSPAASSSSGSSASSGSSGGSSAKTYTGDEASTRWGTVQVEITVQDGKITKSEAIEYPQNNGRDQEINSYAVPQLNSEAIRDQNGNIDAVSGATVTSGGYIESLQSAIDKAHL